MYSKRSYYIYFAVILVGVVYCFKLLQLQVMDDQYAKKADNISLQKQTIYPQRGLIFDRNKKLLVYNDPVYDLMVQVPIRIKGIDTSSFCALLQINREDFNRRIDRSKRRAYNGKSVFMKNVPNSLYAQVQERLFEFEGFFFEIRQDRNYKFNSAAHVLGYLGEVSETQLKEEDQTYYEQGDYNGKKGVERFYEEVLRGNKGQRYFYRDKFGVNQGSYLDGELDIKPQDGHNLTLSIDIDLQQYGEKLLDNKMGSVVAIEPKTGQILALISSPFYNPADFNIQHRSKHYGKALQDPTKPIFNRAVSAPYPPGSTFKPIMALVGIQDGAINANTHFHCGGAYRLGGRIIRCHAHTPNTSLQRSIASSCNTYYCNTFKRMITSSKYETSEEAYNSWREYLMGFGIGLYLNSDISGESRGWLKEATFYDRMHGKGRWNYASIISLSFGQGELGLTPLHMANAVSVIANRGYYYPPHVIKEIEGVDTIPMYYRTKVISKIEPHNFEAVAEGMHLVTTSGTSAATQIKDVNIAGKTGTVQNPHGKNHSAYVAFAPIENPKIAIAVVVEESGYGATWAAPIAHLMIEHYLSPDTATTNLPWVEERLMKADLIPEKYREKMREIYGN